MRAVYKYRGNIERDTELLIKNELFAPTFTMLNDPFEASCELPQERQWANIGDIKQEVYNAGVYSLAKLQLNETFPSNELLWAHYVNAHKGFCIEYDLDKLRDGIKPKMNLKRTISVAYSSERPILYQNELNDIFTIQQKVFGTKSLPWQYENEVRLIFEDKGIKQYTCDAITKIYFGLNISYEHRQNIIDHINKNVKLFQISRVGKTYALSANLLGRDDVKKCEIILEKHYPTVENYYLYYYAESKDENSLTHLIRTFRADHENRPMNICVYDDKCVISFLGKYPLTEQEKEIDSKHWIAMSTFDAPELIWMYPGRIQ